MVDKRVKRTHKLLATALLELASEQDYASITIKDITERADVAYITFFRHYETKDELLVTVLEEITQEIESIARANQTGFDHHYEAKLVFEHVQSNARLYALLLNNSGASKARKSVKNSFAETILHHLEKHQLSDIPIQIAANHIAASFLALIEWWLDENMPYPPEYMATIYVQMILKPFDGLLEHGDDLPQLKKQPAKSFSK
ncbi:MAG: TetR/AcrR family transcriptional regulator [Anaerolineae bacterium]|nr:TetR/AcrR family transcriptional regulator [Anaerolineae bacterium]